MKIIQFLLDSIFPPRKSDLIVRSIKKSDLQQLYQTQRVPNGISLSSYTHTVISALISENKFYANRAAAELLASLVQTWLQSQTMPIIFIPVPLGKRRLRERGENQVLAVLRYLTPHAQFSIRPELCIRVRETPPQVSFNRHDRLANMQGAFAAQPAALAQLRDVTIVIVDDVYTTGATMHAVQGVLTPHLHSSCRITCLALAH